MTTYHNNRDSGVNGVVAQILTLILALVIGGFVAIGTVWVFAILFQPFKEMIPVAFFFAAFAGSAIGLGLRRTILALLRRNTRHEEST